MVTILIGISPPLIPALFPQPRFEDTFSPRGSAEWRLHSGALAWALRAGYAFNPSWRVNLSVNNIFDKQYETAAFYRQPGRTWMLTLRYAAQ